MLLGKEIDARLVHLLKHFYVKCFKMAVVDALKLVGVLKPNTLTSLPLANTTQFCPIDAPPYDVIVGKSALLVIYINGFSILSTDFGI